MIEKEKITAPAKALAKLFKKCPFVPESSELFEDFAVIYLIPCSYNLVNCISLPDIKSTKYLFNADNSKPVDKSVYLSTDNFKT